MTGTTGGVAAFSLFFLAAACESPEGSLARLFADSTAWVDLTHPFDHSTIYWPTARPFQLDTVTAGITPQGYYYAANTFCAAEHGGTHLDAPRHFARGAHTVEQIPLHRLLGPAVVVDVTAAAAVDSEYRISVEDLEAARRGDGPFPPGAIVLLRTGWAARWPDPEAYLGTDRRGPDAVADLRFPGLDSAAARWLVDAGVDAVGIDTPSIDTGRSRTFESHRILAAADMPAFENLAHLDRLPPRGAYVLALPMTIAGGSGAPLRMVAAIPHAVLR